MLILSKKYFSIEYDPFEFLLNLDVDFSKSVVKWKKSKRAERARA